MAMVYPDLHRITYMEDILYQTGWGIYYKFLVGFTCVNSLISAIVLVSISFALPLSACGSLLSKDDAIIIHISFALGRAFGGFLLCTISDNNGKKCMIPKTLIIVFISCFVIAFFHNTYSLYVAAFFLGSGLQANIVTMKIYLAEILPASSRGFYMVIPDLFWTLGYFVSAAFAYLIKTTTVIEHGSLDMKLTTWRGVFAIAGGLALTTACSSALLEMSPRFLLLKRRVITASLVLKQFYAINKSKYSETFDLQTQQLFNLVQDYDINNGPEPVTNCAQFTNSFRIMVNILKVLVRRRFLGLCTILVIFNIAVVFGTLGINILLAKTLSFENKTYIDGLDFIQMTVSNGENCTDAVESAVYENFFLLSVNILFGQILLLCVIDRIGRKIPIFVGLLTCGLMSSVLAYSKNFGISALASSVLMMGYCVTESTVFVVMVESFPTAVRATAIASTTFYALITSSLLYGLLYIPNQNFFIIMGCFMLGVSVLACFFQDLKGRPMVE